MEVPQVAGYPAVREMRLAEITSPVIGVTAQALLYDWGLCLEGCFGRFISEPKDWSGRGACSRLLSESIRRIEGSNLDHAEGAP
ncbi:MAG: hypothetical protein ACJAYU_001713 [Bradymonadia bacterium]|jgi:hypothetical protein